MATDSNRKPCHSLRPYPISSPPSPGRFVLLSLGIAEGIRSEQALKSALAEMYVQGVSTRKVSAIVKQCSTFFDAELDGWRNRPFESCRYACMDARYEKVREGD